ncbi:MAG TPA: hypothetical protein VGJ52_05305, partial [Vicinamibacterales bacterium]
LYREPSMPGIRVDSGVVENGEISVHYDPLIAKLIADGETRDIARRRAVEALRNYPILGIRTNVSFLIEVLEHPRFVAGDIDTRFLDVEGEQIRARSATDPSPEVLEVARAITAKADLSRRFVRRSAEREGGSTAGEDGGAKADPWDTLRGYRG